MPARGQAGRGPRKGLILAICCSALFMVTIDVSIVNVALPWMGRDLHASLAGLQWTVDVYTLVLAGLLILGGSTGDRVGRRRVFRVGLATFVAGSALCSAAPTVGVLVVARALQATGGAMLNPVALGIITNTYTERSERGRAVGMWSAATGLSFGLGPLVGGVLTEALGWRSVFWVNVPVGLTALLLTALFVPESRAARVRRVDPVGQGLMMTTLVALVFGLIEGPRLGWSSPGCVAAFATAGLAFVALVAYEPRQEEPLVDLRFFANAQFSSAIGVAIIASAGWSAFLFALTLYLQGVRGLSALHAGLCSVSAGAAMLVLSPVSGILTGARGPRAPFTLSGLIMAGAGVLLALALTPATALWVVVLAFALFGAAFALVNPAISHTAVSGMPDARAGAAGAFASTARQVGNSLGVAVTGSLGAAAVAGAARAHAVADARPLWWTIAGTSAAVAILGILFSGPRAQRSADRIRPLLEAEG